MQCFAGILHPGAMLCGDITPWCLIPKCCAGCVNSGAVVGGGGALWVYPYVVSMTYNTIFHASWWCSAGASPGAWVPFKVGKGGCNDRGAAAEDWMGVATGGRGQIQQHEAGAL